MGNRNTRSTAPRPNVLVIGAMKAGTTSLWSDLARSEQIFVPRNKESGGLCSDAPLTDDQFTRYLRNFQSAGSADVRIDFSTDMAKRPLFERTASNARRLLGPDVRIVYVTRDPIGRLKSQHAHEARLGFGPQDLAASLAKSGQLIDNGRYAFQLEPWAEQYPRNRFLITSLESYISDRSKFFTDLGRFLDVDLDEIAASEPVRKNAAAVGIRNPNIRAILSSDLYRRRVAHVVPDQLKDAIRDKILRKRSPQPTTGWEDLPIATRTTIAAIYAHDRTEMMERWNHDPTL